MDTNDQQFVLHMISALLLVRISVWDSLRADPRFEKLCQQKQP
jgi:hypothetical protein